MIDFESLEIDAAGLAAYLDHGYCVFQRTPIRNVRYMPPSSRLTVAVNGRLELEAVEDDLAKFLDTRRTESNVVKLIRSRIRAA